jgi:hypothetical protein
MDEENKQIAHFTWYQAAKEAHSGEIKNSPPTGSGKILKRILRERFWAHEQRAVG